MSDKNVSTCEICGEPMPKGEEVFKHHGFSCDCPKPPLKRTKVVIEYVHRDTRDGEFWIDVLVEKRPYKEIGPFLSSAERQRAHDDLLRMIRSVSH